MPAFFINPIDEEHIELLNRLDVQNQDLRVFVSDKNSQDFIDKIPGKKAIGDITDDSHISTASEGDRKSTRLNSSHSQQSRMPSSA